MSVSVKYKPISLMWFKFPRHAQGESVPEKPVKSVPEKLTDLNDLSLLARIHKLIQEWNSTKCRDHYLYGYIEGFACSK